MELTFVQPTEAAVLAAAAIIISHAYHCGTSLFSIMINLNGTVFTLDDAGESKPTSVWSGRASRGQ